MNDAISSFKQNFSSWLIAAIILAMGGITTWVLKITTDITQLQTMGESGPRILALAENNQAALSQLTVELQAVSVVREVINRIDERSIAAMEAVANHRKEDWHKEAGLQLRAINTKLKTVDEWLRLLERDMRAGDKAVIKQMDEQRDRILESFDRSITAIRQQVADQTKERDRIADQLQKQMADQRDVLKELFKQQLRTGTNQ